MILHESINNDIPQRFFKALAYFIILLFIVFLITPNAHAHSNFNPQALHAHSENPNSMGIPTTGPGANGCVLPVGKMTANIVSCIKKILYGSPNDPTAVGITEKFVNVMTNSVGKMVYAATVLGFITFTFLILFGNINAPAGDTMKFILKLVIILAFSSNSNGILVEWGRIIINTSEAMSNIAGSTIGKVLKVTDIGAGTKGSCTPPKVVADNVWDKFDCVALTLLGEDPDNLSIDSIFRIGVVVGGLFLSNDTGVEIILLVITTITTLIFAMATSVLMYITAMIAIAVLTAMAPIVMPLWLFTPTQKIFTLWIYHIIVYAIQPLIIVAFLAMSLHVLDKVATMVKKTYDVVECSNQQQQPKKCKASKAKKAKAPTPVENIPVGPEVQPEMSEGWLQRAINVLNEYTGIPDAISNLKDITMSTIECVTGITECVQNAVAGAIKLAIPMPYIKLTKEEFSEIALTQFLALTTLTVIISFMKKLPQWIDRWVAKGSMANISNIAAGNAAMAEGLVKGGLRKIGGG